jgi:hypothetical protein
MATKPSRVQYAWKHADKRMDVFAKELLKWLGFDTDSNASLAGVQNPFDLNAVTFRADCPGVDVFAIGIAPGGGHNTPGFWRGALSFTLKQTGGIDADQDSFEILAPAKAADIVIGDHIETPSGEYLRVEGITTGSPNYTLTVERGAHGTDKAAVAYNGSLKLLSPKTGMKRIILQGDTTPLAAPVMATPQGQESAILLSWSYEYSTADLLRLKGWKIYYAKTAAIDVENSETYEGAFDVEGIDKFTLFSPKSESGLADVNTTYYFAMVAMTKSLQISELSNEVFGKAYGTIGPIPGGPVTPKAKISVDVAFRLLIEAGNDTDGKPQAGVQNVDTATFEVYSAPTPELANPTTGDPDENQTLLGTLVDKSNPYSTKLGVTQYISYWARVKFTDGASQTSAWGIAVYDPDSGAQVLTLSKQNNTLDSGVPSGVTIETRLIASFKTVSGIWRNRILSGVYATTNIDSADRCEFFLRINGEGTFSSISDDPFGVGTTRVIKSGGHPATCDYEWGEGQKIEITARVHNNYGWSPWSTPQELKLLKSFEGDDTDVCDLAEFGAWSLNNAPPGGWSAAGLLTPQGNEVVFKFDLGDTNESTVFQVSIEGIDAGSSFPSENVRYSNESSGLTLVGVAGTKTLILSGLSPDISANALQNKFVRIGRSPGKNVYETLQVLKIDSNTASVGGVTTITVKGTAALYVTSQYGAQQKYQYWQIIDQPIWELLDFYEDVRVDPEYFGALPAKIAALKRDTTGKKFRARAHNQWGRGAYRYADATAVGAAAESGAVAKIIKGVESDDLGDGEIKAVKAEKKLQPVSISGQFTPTGNNELEWDALTIKYGDKTSDSISSGSKASLATNTAYWMYFTPNDNTLYFTTDMDIANDGARVVIGIVRTTADADEMCSIHLAGAGESVLGVDKLFVSELSALSAETVYFTGGHIRTAKTGSRVELDSSNGVRLFAGTTAAAVLEFPIDGYGRMLIRPVMSGGTLAKGWIECQGVYKIKGLTLVGGNVMQILPEGSNAYLQLGESGSKWDYLHLHSNNGVEINDYLKMPDQGSGGGNKYVYVEDGAVVVDTSAP